jgi:protein-disulfide isomerase
MVKKNKTNSSKKIFFAILISLIFFSIIFTFFLDTIFPTVPAQFSKFNFDYHNNLTFDDSYRGTNPDSKIQFVVFMDFYCPACIEQYPIILQLIEKYKDVNFMIRIVPKSDDVSAFSAVSYECARQQKKEFQMGELLINGYQTISAISDISRNVDLNRTLYSECIGSENTKNIINGDLGIASFINVRGTPTTFINGIKIEGIHSYQVYDELLNSDLVRSNLKNE